MKHKEQQFINAWELFLNDCLDTNTKKQNNKNDLTFTEACLMVIVIAIICFMC